MIAKWLTALFGYKNRAASKHASIREIALEDLVVAPGSWSDDRAERALPGTRALPRILDLVPPSIQGLGAASLEDGDRDYGPDPIAECVVRYPARQIFRCSELSGAMTREWLDQVLGPTFYVKTPTGRTTYLSSSDAPDSGIELLASWPLREHAALSAAALYEASLNIGRWLENRPGQFTATLLDEAEISAKLATARHICEVAPHSVGIVNSVETGELPFDGRKVWKTLHSMGFRWGDMDCFQWQDATNQVDYLIWVEVDDGTYGYALPEEIAAGRQNFSAVRFSIDPARTPSPDHVSGELVRAAQCFQKQLGGTLRAYIDDQFVDSLDQLRLAVRRLVAEFDALGMQPASNSILQLR
jgi:hypothetical protein